MWKLLKILIELFKYVGRVVDWSGWLDRVIELSICFVYVFRLVLYREVYIGKFFEKGLLLRIYGWNLFLICFIGKIKCFFYLNYEFFNFILELVIGFWKWSY